MPILESTVSEEEHGQRHTSVYGYWASRKNMLTQKLEALLALLIENISNLRLNASSANKVEANDKGQCS